MDSNRHQRPVPEDVVAHHKSAMVLSGGGSLGAVQAGMLLALSEAGVAVDLIVGASVGALNGAFYADDPTPAGAARLVALWRGLQRRDVFPLTLWAGLKALVFGRDHLVEPAALRGIVCRALRMQRLEEARVELHVVATDILSGADVLLSHGEVAGALLASTAIPVVFPPVLLEGRQLVDGGVSNNTPITNAIALGADRILVLPTGTSCALTAPPHNMAALALHVLGLQNMRQLDRDIERHAGEARITVVPPLCPLDVSVFDFSHTDALIARAVAQTRRWIAGGGLQTSGPLHVPLAHRDRPTAKSSGECEPVS